jgi:spectinomycin phosphotransferase
MRFDTAGLDLDDLAIELSRTYGLSVTSVAFVPKGEDAFCYVAATATGEQYFVRAKPAERGTEAEAIYEAVAALRDRLGIRAVMAPLRSAQGRLSREYRGHVITVYRFIAGTTVYESGAPSAHVAKAARIMAVLHRSDYSFLPPLPFERFDNPFEPAINEALTAVTAIRPRSGYERRVADLLVREQSDVRETLDRMRRMQRAIVRLRAQPVVTHGDPNWANFLVDPEGALFMTDWGELALGPRERDLMFFTGEHFDAFLPAYLARSGPIRLHRLLFAFYLYRWAMQEIADYTTRILSPEATPEGAEHAWAELQPYLPVPHGEIGDGVTAVMATLHRLEGDGLQTVDRDLST